MEQTEALAEDVDGAGDEDAATDEKAALPELLNGGTLQRSQAIAGRESPRTTQLNDRTAGDITVEDIERLQGVTGDDPRQRFRRSARRPRPGPRPAAPARAVVGCLLTGKPAAAGRGRDRRATTAAQSPLPRCRRSSGSRRRHRVRSRDERVARPRRRRSPSTGSSFALASPPWPRGRCIVADEPLGPQARHGCAFNSTPNCRCRRFAARRESPRARRRLGGQRRVRRRWTSATPFSGSRSSSRAIAPIDPPPPARRWIAS